MIECRNLCVSYEGQHVLQDFSVDIPTDRNTVILGASGSGKTTLLCLLLGLRKPDSGDIRGAAHMVLSAVFQEDRLLPWLTAEENVALVSDTVIANELLTRLGLADAAHERPSQLSGGMKRRVAIARALAISSDMLLLDEPFNGLDADAKAVAANVILEAKTPLVLVTHNREDAELLSANTTIAL